MITPPNRALSPLCPPTPDKYANQNYQHGLIDSVIVNGRLITFEPQEIGAGDFSTIHKAAAGWIIKLPQPNRRETAIQDCRNNAKTVYTSLIAHQNALTERNICVIPTVFTDATSCYAILQPQITPLCSSMKAFSPPWKHNAELCPEALQLLQTVKAAFALFLEHNLVVDFKPDNVTWDGTTLGVFDFHETETEFRVIVPSLLRDWAQNNQNIFNYLDPR